MILKSRLESIAYLKAAAPAVLPSMLLCDFTNLRNEINKLTAAGFSALHLDVMDGVFVPNISYGLTIVEAVRECTDLLIDVHLMMVNPEKYLADFKRAGADVLTVHAEAVENPTETLENIRALDMVAGLALNPATPVTEIESQLPFADLVLVMSVQAGFGGQSFDSSVLPKFGEIRERSNDVILEIDGGVNSGTIEECKKAGAELMVAGSAIFKTDDYEETHEHLRMLIGGVHEPN